MVVSSSASTRPRASAAAAPSDLQHKVKTAAKTRYLKKKKDTRKKKKAAQKSSASKVLAAPATPVQDEAASSIHVAEGTPNETSLSRKKDKKKKDKSKKVAEDVVEDDAEMDIDDRPRKKRKVTPEPAPDHEEHQGPTNTPAAVKLTKSKSKKKKAKSPSPIPSSSSVDNDSDVDPAADDAEDAPAVASEPAVPSTLPLFPLPSQPAAPSAAELGRQGLDAALLSATRIDAQTTLPLKNASLDGVLSDRMQKRLTDMGVTELFAVQTALIPHLLPSSLRSARSARALYRPYDPPSDVCVSAPTGSGKTLAYAVPIVEVLSSRVVSRLRALVVLPTRDLVTQVRDTFESLAKGTGLRIGSISGTHSFAHEQAALVDKTNGMVMGESKVDILICTPGRLIDHIDDTPGFTLGHLRFLVVDEADRLLAQSFQDWLARVRQAIEQPLSSSESIILPPHLLSGLPGPTIHPALAARPSTQKLLLSATLTRDPGRLNALGLVRPQYFVVTTTGADIDAMDVDVAPDVAEEFGGSLPASLQERMVVCEGADKPLVLAHLLGAEQQSEEQEPDRGQVLVFCKSVEAATRLAHLLSHVFASSAGKTMSVMAYSSDTPRSVLERFRKGDVTVLVCSDLASRGLDVSSIRRVFSYDAPLDMRKYVHRAGRTARAGREGEAWTLLETQEAAHFKRMMREATREDKVKKVRVREPMLEPLRTGYENALKSLADTFGRGGA